MGRERGDLGTFSFDEEFLRECYESVNDTIFVHDGETGEIIDANRTACEMYGYSKAELTQLSLEDLSSGNPPYTQEKAIERVKITAEGGPQIFEWEARDADENVFWAEVSMRASEIDDQPVTFVTVRDISTRKAYEKKLEDQRDNLEILNQVVRHDIRNNLQVVQGYAELLENEVSDDGRSHLQTIQKSSTHAIRLTETARDLADVMLQTDIETEHISLAEIIEEQIDQIRTEHPDAEISTDSPLPNLTIQGNEMLHSVFRNLFQNAIQHNDKEVPKVSVSVTKSEKLVHLHIADNGPGIPDSQKDSIFGKGEKGLKSSGTGIGLYLVKTLVEGYGGDVWVEDNEPAGAMFVVALPLTDT